MQCLISKKERKKVRNMDKNNAERDKNHIIS